MPKRGGVRFGTKPIECSCGIPFFHAPDPNHVVDWGELVIDADGTFEEGPVRIMDSQD